MSSQNEESQQPRWSSIEELFELRRQHKICSTESHIEDAHKLKPGDRESRCLSCRKPLITAPRYKCEHGGISVGCSICEPRVTSFHKLDVVHQLEPRENREDTMTMYKLERDVRIMVRIPGPKKVDPAAAESEKQQRRDLNRRLAEKLVAGWSAYEYREKFDNEIALAQRS